MAIGKLETEYARKFISQMLEFIDHNEKNGVIDNNTTVEELKRFLENVNTMYLPVIENINDLVKNI